MRSILQILTASCSNTVRKSSAGEKRLFRLLPAELQITVMRFGRTSRRFNLPLKRLSPESSILQKRNSYFRMGLGFLTFGMIALLLVCARARYWLDVWNPKSTWQSFAGSIWGDVHSRRSLTHDCRRSGEKLITRYSVLVHFVLALRVPVQTNQSSEILSSALSTRSGLCNGLYKKRPVHCASLRSAFIIQHFFNRPRYNSASSASKQQNVTTRGRSFVPSHFTTVVTAISHASSFG